MPSPRLRAALVTACLAVSLATGAALASERSELLVAQGEVAYHAGRIEEARRLFTDALAADPNEQAARNWLDVIASRLPRERARGERREAAARPWDLEIGTGVQYDSNVDLDPEHGEEDAGLLFRLGGHYDPYRDDKTLVRLDYDFLQVLHLEVHDFDVRSNRIRGTVSRAVTPSLWLGLQGGYDHTTLHTHAYLQQPWVSPYLSIIEGDFGATQILYRHAEQDYLGAPFGGFPVDRDGMLDAAELNQLFFFLDRRLAVTLGYMYEEATPHKKSGDDYARQTHQGRINFRFPAWWRTMVELEYVYRYDDYTEPNSNSPSGKTRQDNGNYVATFLRRPIPIVPNLDGVVSYFATVNGSNLPLFDYSRQIVAFELRYYF
jgi:hypothetical protein